MCVLISTLVSGASQSKPYVVGSIMAVSEMCVLISTLMSGASLTKPFVDS